MFCVLKDPYTGLTQEAGLVDSTAQAVLWFHERGIRFEDVKASDDGYKTVFEAVE